MLLGIGVLQTIKKDVWRSANKRALGRDGRREDRILPNKTEALQAEQECKITTQNCTFRQPVLNFKHCNSEDKGPEYVEEELYVVALLTAALTLESTLEQNEQAVTDNLKRRR